MDGNLQNEEVMNSSTNIVTEQRLDGSTEESFLVTISGHPFCEVVSNGNVTYRSILTEEEFDSYESAAVSVNVRLQEAFANVTADASCSINDSDLMQSITKYLKRYIYLEREEEYFLVAAYIVLTYCFEMFIRIPYLNVKGMQGSGKTTLMQVMNALVAKPKFISNITEAAIFRIIDEAKPTLLLDEAEKYGNPAGVNASVFQIINSGYQRDGKVARTIKGETVEYSTFGPKIIGAIKRPIPTIEDRCLIINMKVSDTRNLSPFNGNPSEMAEATKIKMQINSFIKGSAKRLYEYANGIETLFINPLIKNRDRDKWYPILILAELMGNDKTNYMTTMNTYARDIVIKKQESDENKPENVCKRLLLEFVKANIGNQRKIPKQDTQFYYAMAEEFAEEVYEKDRINSYTGKGEVTKALRLAGITSSRRRFAPLFSGPVIVYRVPVGLIN